MTKGKKTARQERAVMVAFCLEHGKDYLLTVVHKLYLSTILDLCDRRIVVFFIPCLVLQSQPSPGIGSHFAVPDTECGKFLVRHVMEIRMYRAGNAVMRHQ